MSPDEIDLHATAALRAHEAFVETDYAGEQFRAERTAEVYWLHTEAGWSKARIARHLGITRSRVGQILGQPAPTKRGSVK